MNYIITKLMAQDLNHEHDRIKEHDIMKHGNHEQREHGIGSRV